MSYIYRLPKSWELNFNFISASHYSGWMLSYPFLGWEKCSKIWKGSEICPFSLKAGSSSPKEKNLILDQVFLLIFSFLKFKSYKELASGSVQSCTKQNNQSLKKAEEIESCLKFSTPTRTSALAEKKKKKNFSPLTEKSQYVNRYAHRHTHAQSFFEDLSE